MIFARWRLPELLVISSLLAVGCNKPPEDQSASQSVPPSPPAALPPIAEPPVPEAVVAPTPDADGPASTSASVPPESSPLPETSSVRPSSEELDAWTAAITQAIAERKSNDFNGLIDWEAIIRAATDEFEDIPNLEQIRRSFRIGTARSQAGGGGLAGDILLVMSGGGDYRLVRTYVEDGQQHALFRQTGGAIFEGLNYHDYTLSHHDDGTTRAVRVYLLSNGETVAQSYRRALLPILSQLDANLQGEPESLLVKHQNELTLMNQLLRFGDKSQALATFAQLPAGVQQIKSTLLLRAQAARWVGVDEYQQAIADLRKHYPDDPCIDLLDITGYLSIGEFAKAQLAVDRVEKVVGNDAYLHFLRSMLYMVDKDFESAKASAHRAADLEPDLMRVQYLLMDIALRARDHTEPSSS